MVSPGYLQTQKTKFENNMPIKQEISKGDDFAKNLNPEKY
jgi:hypothetical protein